MSDSMKWLFDGVGGGLALLLLGLYLSRRRKSRQSEQRAVLRVESPQVKAETSANVKPEEAEPADVPTLTVNQILDELDETAFLMREEYARRLLGAPVVARGVLTTAGERQGKLIVVLNCDPDQLKSSLRLATIIVLPQDYPGFGVLKAKHRINATGTVAAVEWGSVTINNARLSW